MFSVSDGSPSNVAFQTSEKTKDIGAGLSYDPELCAIEGKPNCPAIRRNHIAGASGDQDGRAGYCDRIDRRITLAIDDDKLLPLTDKRRHVQGCGRANGLVDEDVCGELVCREDVD